MTCTQWMRGMYCDLQKRIPHYVSDWTTDALHQKVLSSSLFMFFTSIAPAITFSLYMTDTTGGDLGAVEILLASAITGVVFAIFGGQPLVILGVTGPIAILTASIYTLSQSWGLKFIPFYAWSQIWAGIIQLFLSFSNSCCLLQYVTQFSCETFGVLIALIYLYTGLEGIATMFDEKEFTFPSALLQFIVAIGTALTSLALSHARHWSIFNEPTRHLIADYGAAIAIVLWSAVPYMAYTRLEPEDDVPKLYVPLQFGTTNGRPWLVDLSDIPTWGMFAAIFPGFIIAVLFFFDHNVSSMIAQHREFGLRKGTAFHWDYFVVGVTCFITGILGIPPTNGLIPQAPLHVKSLSVMKRVVRDGEPTAHFEVDYVIEQRVSNMLQAVLTGLAMIRPFCEALRSIPTAVLYGLFLFLGMHSFEDNEFPARVALLFTDSEILRGRLRAASGGAGEAISTGMAHILNTVNMSTIYKFTLVQAIMCGLIFGVTFTPAEVIFPVLIALLVVVRLWFLPSLFSEEDLAALDKSVLSHEDTRELVEFGNHSDTTASSSNSKPSVDADSPTSGNSEIELSLASPTSERDVI